MQLNHTGQPTTKDSPDQNVSGANYVPMLQLSDYVPMGQFISRCVSFCYECNV